MRDRFKELDAKQIAFIQKQQIFFVGSAAADGHVNVSGAAAGLDWFLDRPTGLLKKSTASFQRSA